jgi:sugar lactone lactonase YvrE
MTGVVVWVLAAAAASAQVQTVAQFNATLLETPESIAIDRDNNKYVSLALTGEIRKIAPDGAQSTYAVLPLGAPPLTICGPFFGGVVGITFDEHGNLYASLASCDPASRGVWKIPGNGQPSRIAALPVQSLPNGIVHHRDTVYVADSVAGAIWRVADTGGAGADAGAERPARSERPEAVRGRALCVESVSGHRGRDPDAARRLVRRSENARIGGLLRRLRVRRPRQPLLHDRPVQFGCADRA